jgi:glutamine amidotransferase
LRIGILDLGINNLSSVKRSFSADLRPADSIVVIDDSRYEAPLDLIILPGLGKFEAGMRALNERNLVERIREWHLSGSKIVGICLGMQLLGTESQESPGVPGLKLIQGCIEKLPNNLGERVPHIGWAETTLPRENKSFSSMGDAGDYYFVHSFHFIPKDENNVLTRTTFGKMHFASSILSNNIFGVQFHPEKSGSSGAKLVNEIVQWAKDEN